MLEQGPPSGERVVLWKRQRGSMTVFHPGFVDLLEYYEKGEYLPDND